MDEAHVNSAGKRNTVNLACVRALLACNSRAIRLQFVRNSLATRLQLARNSFVIRSQLACNSLGTRSQFACLLEHGGVAEFDAGGPVGQKSPPPLVFVGGVREVIIAVNGGIIALSCNTVQYRAIPSNTAEYDEDVGWV